MRIRRTLSLFAAFFAAPLLAVAQGKVDVYGDPLPAGAVARFGTTRLRHTSWLCDAVFSADAKVLASYGVDQRLRIWSTADGKELRNIPLEFLYLIPWPASIAASADARTVVVSDGRRIAICDTVQGEPQYGRTSSECSVYLWDTATGKTLPGLPGNKRFRSPLAFTPDGKSLVAVQNKNDREEDVVFWDLGKKEIVQRFAVADISCGSVALSRDGKRLAVGGYYRNMLQVFDITRRKELVRVRPPNELGGLVFSEDGNMLITGSSDTTLTVWDLRQLARAP